MHAIGDAFDVSCKLISNFELCSYEPHRIISILNYSRQRISSNSIMECVSAIDVAVMGAPICVENLLLSANTRYKIYVNACAVLSVPTTSVDSKWAIPVLTTAVASLHIHFRCYYRSRKGCIHRVIVLLWKWEEGRHVRKV